MKKKNILFASLIAFTALSYKNVLAFSANDYKYRDLCDTYEVAGFHNDGSIEKVACYNNFQDAQKFMREKGTEDLAILSKVYGESKIIDANVALLDLSVNPETLTYFYTNSELTSSAYTYMDTGSLYGGVDGAFMETGFSNAKGIWTAKVRIGNFTGWIKDTAYEIVPITWIKSASTYTVTNDDIKHNYVAKIQNEYYGSSGRVIGPKPEMLSPGTYYSYDGHYFYKDLKTLINDYKNNNYNNAVNKDKPYYNYYMYLSNHTKTTYSSVNIDEYIRNNLGYKENVYGNSASANTSRLYGSGTFFYYAQEKYGVNAILSLSLSRNETGNGRSNLAINKNNGFGLNAVDSSPTESASWYASFPSSILGYASKWITYGYAHPRDWRYFGPQFGDKWIGMNVKYASDTYWSEKMAANYYSLDKAFGLQDYNYYQLGVVNGPTRAYSEPSTSSKFIYEYPEREDALVIVGETTRNNEKWYKVVSDLNIDSNYNEIYSGDYNWNGYVYVKASDVRKINNGKNGNITPNEVTEYQNKDYEYDLFVQNTVLKPKVAITKKDTPYYYDSSLTSKTGKTLLKDRYVMVYSAAYFNNKAVAYLVTSDYFHDQKEWVSADAIELTNTNYGKVSVTVNGNCYTWVNYNTEDESYSLISGLYTNTYVPVLEAQKVGDNTWYKVPVSLTTNSNVYGYTLAKAYGVNIELSTPIVENRSPVIYAVDKNIVEGDSFDVLKDVKVIDTEDGDLTSKVEVTENNVNTNKAGEYKVTYKVKDSGNQEVTKTIKVTVSENTAPTIEAKDIEITQNSKYDAKTNIKATDKEDGDLTSKIEVTENTVNTKKAGEYKVTYKVVDSRNKETTKTIKVTVIKNESPVIDAKDIKIFKDEKFNELDNVKATDKEDGDLTSKIEVTENTVDTKKIGEYKVTYNVTDSANNTTTKTIKVEVVEKEEIEEIDLDDYHEEDGEFNLESLEWNKEKKYFTISGYLIIENQNNDLDKEYGLLLSDKNSDEIYTIEIPAWTKDTPYDLGTENGKSYTYSCFKGKIDFSDIPNGDYDLLMVAVSGNSYTVQLVDNFFNIDIDRRGEDSEHGYNFKVQQKSKSKEITLSIRDELYTTKEAPTSRNMVNGYDEVTFKNNKLYMYGYSYDYEGVYKDSSSITRKIIIENTSSFKQYIYDLGCTKGPFEIKTLDNKDKTYAWFEKEIDISKLDKGTYSIYIYTKTSNAANYDEITDIFRSINETAKFNNHEYKLGYNKERNNRIELTVK